MVVAASIVDTFATGTGLLAGAIAVGGFISHVGPALSGSSEKKVRQATVLGGLAGLGFGSSVIVLSAYIR
jgi:hypothetical protein